MRPSCHKLSLLELINKDEDDDDERLHWVATARFNIPHRGNINRLRVVRWKFSPWQHIRPSFVDVVLVVDDEETTTTILNGWILYGRRPPRPVEERVTNEMKFNLREELLRMAQEYKVEMTHMFVQIWKGWLVPFHVMRFE